MISRLLICLAVIASVMTAAAPAAADEVELMATVQPEVVPVGSEAELVVTVSGKFRKSDPPQLPELPGFDVYQSGTSQQISIVNGRPSSSLTYRYVLVARQAGKYKIEPIQFKAGDKVYTTSATLEVVASASRLPANQGGTTSGDDVDPEGQSLFVSASVDRDTVYVNQQVTWTLGFYTDGRTDLLRSPEYQPPNAEGFWVEDLPARQGDYRTINGRKYLVSEVNRAFFPTAPGEYVIGGARVDVVVNDRTSRNSVDDFFRRRGSFGFGQPKSIHAREITIVVVPLPTAGRPPNFTGLVGRSLNVALKSDKQVVNAGDPINVSLEIQGEGNFKTIASPKIPDIEGFKMYESGSKSDLFKNNAVVSGRKRTDFVLIPRAEGRQTIPPVSLSYFDPFSEAYQVVTSNGVDVSVQPATREEGRPVIFTGTGENIEVLGRDINFIRPAPATVRRAGDSIYSNRVYLAFHAVPLLALVVSVLAERRRRKWQGDSALVRAGRAAGRAEKTLARAQVATRQGDGLGAWALVATAIREYVADKTDTSAAGLTQADVGSFAERRGVEGESAQTLVSLLKTCDLVQYSGASGPDDAGESIAEALKAIKALEKQLR